MTSLRALCFSCLGFMLSVQVAVGQRAVNSDHIKASLESCGVIRQRLDRYDRRAITADYVAAGQACDWMNEAISASDLQQIQTAATKLRPLLARLGMAPATPQEQLAALEKETSGSSGMKLFYELQELAKRAFNAGDTDKAKAYSMQLLDMAPQYPKNWNYGNALFYGNLVLGQVALQQGNLAQASRYLLAAGATPGSPQLNSFGPDMTLAKGLLEKGQSDVVLQYLALCKNFWAMDYGKLDEWTATVRDGGVPDFGGRWP